MRREVERAHRRPGDEAELLPARGAVDARRPRTARPGIASRPGDQDQRPERQRLPDVHQHREATAPASGR